MAYQWSCDINTVRHATACSYRSIRVDRNSRGGWRGGGRRQCCWRREKLGWSLLFEELTLLTLYGLRVLRAHGLHQDCLDEVFRCTILAKLLYASPAWSGFCSSADIGKIDRFLNRCRKLYRCRLLNQDIAELFTVVDQSLFSSLQKNIQHVLHRFLPATSTQTLLIVMYCLL